MSKLVFMRGLQNFIEEIRSCQNKEQEERRVEKELAKIREKFGDDKGLTGYDKRKYVWKLLYIYILGYKVDFGHRQACDLIPKPKYKDKMVGYAACTILLHENDEFLRLSINGVHLDLTSRNEAFECLALTFVGSVGGQEMAEALVPDILKLLGSGASRPLVKKRAALCLLRMIRKTPADQQVVQPDTFCSCLNGLLEERDMGLLLSAVTLLCGIVTRSGPAGYESCQVRLIRILERLALGKDKAHDIPQEYLYYGIPSPWLQSKALRALQYYPAPEVPAERLLLNNILQGIIDTQSAVDHSKVINSNKNNVLYAVILEAIALALHLDTDPKILASCVTTLGKFLTTDEANIRYLTLENLARLAVLPDVTSALRQQQPVISAALRDADVSIRKRAMDLLFTLCDASNARELVGELLDYLTTADFAMREELVLKIAILAEKHAPDVQWYVDTVFTLLERAGDFVSDDIWQRVVQLVTNNDSMQEYAARKIIEVVRRGASYESVICTAAYILGEYGRLVKAEVPCLDQFQLLQPLFSTSSRTTQGLLMSAFLKIFLQDPQNPELKQEVNALFERLQKLMDAELQQRAAEYLVFTNSPQSSLEKFLLPMPKWPERESTLLRQLQRREGMDDDSIAAAAIAAAAAPPKALQPVDLASLPSSGSLPMPTSATAAAAAAAAAKPPSFDLLMDDEAAPPAASIAAASSDPFDVLLTNSSSAPLPAQPAPKPLSSNPVDLLDDLFGAALAAPQPAAFGAPGPAPPQPLPALVPLALQPYPATPQPPLPPTAPVAMPPLAPASSWGAGAAFAAPTVVSSAYSAPAVAGAAYTAPAVAGAVYTAPTVAGAAYTAPTVASAAPSASLDDPFGDAAFGPPPPPPAAAAPAAAAQFEAARPLGDLATWFNALMYKDRGVLYEDQYLQVGVQSQYANGRGDLSLFLGNKHEQAALQHLAVLVRPSASVQAVAAAPPTQMLPKQQLQVPITLTCLGPVVDLPVVSISYVLGNVSVSQELPLPVASHRFMTPEPTIPKDVFFDQWKAMSGNLPCKAQQMVSRAAPLAHDAVVAVMRQAQLGVEHCYLDPSPYNEAGASSFVYGPPGAQQRVLVMCRVEGNPQNMAQFRVTVVSPFPGLSASTKDLVAARLAA